MLLSKPTSLAVRFAVSDSPTTNFRYLGLITYGNSCLSLYRLYVLGRYLLVSLSLGAFPNLTVSFPRGSISPATECGFIPRENLVSSPRTKNFNIKLVKVFNILRR